MLLVILDFSTNGFVNGIIDFRKRKSCKCKRSQYINKSQSQRSVAKLKKILKQKYEAIPKKPNGSKAEKLRLTIK